MSESFERPRGLTLLTGGTGYVGGRLLDELERRGVPLRCLARRPEHLLPRVSATTEVVSGDVFDRDSLASAMEGVDTAYYMIHSMADSGDFEYKDRRAAELFSEVARQTGVRRIIYLGGLGSGPGLSAHLRSRQEVGAVLGRSGVTTIELRAGIIIGSGSLSFEMIRALVEKLPVMITPSWVRVRTQPIAIEDVISYLVKSRDVEASGHVVFEIGGADQVSYADIMAEYARQRGLHRVMIPVPVLTPYVSSLWLGLVTPLYARVGRNLIDGVRNPTIVDDPASDRPFQVHPRGVREAITRALVNEDQKYAATRWSDALSSKGGLPRGARRYGRRLIDVQSVRVPRPPEEAFAPVRRIGGDRGWYYGNWLWELRGLLDKLAGGPGLRRGRRAPDDLRIGEAVDFWRVEEFQPARLLRLRAEMKLPGRAWLQFEAEPDGTGTILTQTAVFDPTGLGGLLYWYSLLPAHAFVFRGMLNGVAAASATDTSF